MRSALETGGRHIAAALPTYVLITPVRNEEAYLEQTLETVIAQTIRPLRWVIVSDGSTDRTDEIARRYMAAHDWIEFVRMPDRKERHFAGKVRAFCAGAARVRHLPYQIIGNLDADVSFEADYVEYLLGKFVMFPKLGVTGTNQREPLWQERPRYNYRFTNVAEVPGPCQLFRRDCFESIGGYTANPEGGVDLLANLLARMHGWETRVYTGRLLIHQRKQGTAQAHPMFVEFHNGRKDYLFGGHPLWQIFRAAYNMTKKPYVIGGFLMFIGYFSTFVARSHKVFPDDVVRFRRKEQMGRLRAFLRPGAWRQRLDHD
jgi:poly-beta-1,6-N-acetyl-D-glucosamine synthase